MWRTRVDTVNTLLKAEAETLVDRLANTPSEAETETL